MEHRFCPSRVPILGPSVVTFEESPDGALSLIPYISVNVFGVAECVEGGKLY